MAVSRLTLTGDVDRGDLGGFDCGGKMGEPVDLTIKGITLVRYSVSIPELAKEADELADFLTEHNIDCLADLRDALDDLRDAFEEMEEAEA